jgi:hypothetical protein
LLDSDPNLYLNKIPEQLMDQHNISVSLSTIQRMLRLLGITSKKVCFSSMTFLALIVLQLSKVAAEQCEEARQTFLYQISQEPAWCLIFTDEISINMLTMYHTMGHVLKGKHARVRSY